MANRRTQYTINQTALIVQYGDITKCAADAIVSSDDNYLSMGGGVSYAISQAAGNIIRSEAKKQLPLKLGDVAVTSAGRLDARYVFHAITIDYDNSTYANDEIVSRATRRCLEIADSLRVKTIALPALGTGVARFPFERCATAMARTLVEYLAGDTKLETVTITLFPREGTQAEEINVFYERAAALAAVASGKKDLYQLISELDLSLGAMGKPYLQRKFQEFCATLAAGGDVVDNSNAVSQTSADSINFFDETSRLTIATRAVIEETSWDTRELEMKLVRTKYQGYMTQLNINVSHLNSLEIEKAKYGGVGIPPRLDAAINDLRAEISKLEENGHDLRAQLAVLGAH